MADTELVYCPVCSYWEHVYKGWAFTCPRCGWSRPESIERRRMFAERERFEHRLGWPVLILCVIVVIIMINLLKAW